MNSLLPQLIVAAAAVAAAASAAFAQAPAFTAEQASAGALSYQEHCELCHGANLDDGFHAAPLKGPAFKAKWGGKPLSDLYDYINTNMPPGEPGMLGPDGNAEVMAHILQGNGLAEGATPLPSTPEALAAIILPAE